MDSIGGVVSIVGAILSGIGCYYAWCQARRALTARQEIECDRKNSSIIESSLLARRAREESILLQKGRATSVRGVDLQAVVNKIRECLQHIGDCSHRFEDSKLSTLISDSIGLIGKYSACDSEDIGYFVASELYRNLCSIVSSLEKIKDESL